MLHGELVERAGAEAGDEQFPDAAGNVLAHRVAAAVPALKSPTTLTLSAFGAQTAKFTPRHAVDRPQLRAELLVALPVRAFAQQVQVVVGQQRREGVGIVHGRGSRQICRSRGAGSCGGSRTGSLADLRRRSRLRVDDRFVQAGRVDPPHRPRLAVRAGRRPRPAGPRAKRPAPPTPAGRRPQSRADPAPRTGFRGSRG